MDALTLSRIQFASTVLRCFTLAGALAITVPGCLAIPVSSRSKPVRDLAPTSVFAERIQHIHGVAADGFGNVYVSSSAHQGSVVRINASGEQAPVATGLGRVAGLARDDLGSLFVAMTWGKGGIYRIGSEGRRALVVKGIGYPAETAVDDRGRVYIAESLSRGRLLRYADEELLTWAGPLHLPKGVAVDVESSVYVCESASGRILRYHSDGARHVLVPSGILTQPGGITYTPQYRGLFVTEDRARGRLSFVSVDGPIVTLLYDLRYPKGLALDGQGDLYIAEQGRKRLLRIQAEDLSAALNRS